MCGGADSAHLIVRISVFRHGRKVRSRRLMFFVKFDSMKPSLKMLIVPGETIPDSGIVYAVAV
jgi:hypothetical protein